MKKTLSIIFAGLMVVLIAGGIYINSRGLDEFPFANGELDARHEKEGVRLMGQVTAIAKMPGTDATLYQLNLDKPGVKPIWASPYVPSAREINLGETLIFNGHIVKSETIDTTGKLKSITNSTTLLMAETIQTP